MKSVWGQEKGLSMGVELVLGVRRIQGLWSAAVAGEGKGGSNGEVGSCVGEADTGCSEG